MDLCAGRSRAVSVAWALEWLVARDGHATATNEHLARETGIPLPHVSIALDDLERAGLIERRPAAGRRRAIRPTLPDSYCRSSHNGYRPGSSDSYRDGSTNTANQYTKGIRRRAVADIGTVADASRAVGWAVSDLKAAALSGDFEAMAKAAERLRALFHDDEPAAAGGGGR
jgi:hypothetical protein